MILLNVSLIILQIYAMNNNAALSYMGSAIWAGVYNLSVVIMVLFTSKYFRFDIFYYKNLISIKSNLKLNIEILL